MTAGRVTVNGQVVTELGSKVDPAVDVVAVDGAVVTLSDTPVTLMLNKPAGYVTTMSDPHARHTVAELVPCEQYPGLFPIGRLDQDTTGLLLFSTDGDLANRLLHPAPPRGQDVPGARQGRAGHGRPVPPARRRGAGGRGRRPPRACACSRPSRRTRLAPRA